MLMRNNVAYNVVGIGTMAIKMRDEVIRTFENVIHVPDFQRNLIYFDSLDDISHVCKVESGAIRVSKGAFTIMKGIKRNGLYILSSYAIIRSTTLITSKLKDSTQFWHNKLSHINEKGLHILCKVILRMTEFVALISVIIAVWKSNINLAFLLAHISPSLF